MAAPFLMALDLVALDLNAVRTALGAKPMAEDQ
jgi:hypothetical protein